jgi:putative effector of murein hydrolase LrgA (UPF0299 family)
MTTSRSLYRSLLSAGIIALGALVSTVAVLGLSAIATISLKAAQITERHHLPAPEAVLGMMAVFALLLWLGKAVTSAGREDA